MHRSRPIYISIIAWLYLIGAGLTVLSLALMIYDPKVVYSQINPDTPFALILAQTSLGAIVTAVGAWNLLRGANWARWLMTVFLVESTTWTFLSASIPASFWVALLWSVIMITVLFIPPSNEFFRARRGRRRRIRSVVSQA
ncbi:MAG: hypothetical protein K0R17_100 [Rariglobus sp.]|jgi:hypothetical protein|nr:hypothetical protein [Rariglobus sp.]